MPDPSSSFSIHLSQVKQTLSYLATGGEWALGLPERTRQNLSWFWLDGFFAAASDNIVTTYVTVYLLVLGASGAQIGILSSLSSLAAAIMLFPGAILVERFGRRKHIFAINGGGAARLAILGLALVPFFLQGPTLVTIAMFFSVMRDTFTNLGYPAWLSLTADLVPLSGRGRYFASRNFATGLAGMISTLAVGFIITQASHVSGYQAALGLAFILGIGSTFSFLHIHDPQPLQGNSPKEHTTLSGFGKNLKSQRVFINLCLTTALWNLALNVAGPFFNVHLVEKLDASAAMVGVTTIATSLTGVLSQRYLGEISDRIGSRRLQEYSGLLIPIVPLLWYFATNAWQIVFINGLSGILWAGYNLASFNFMLSITPSSDRPRYSAIYQLVVTASLSAGAALGSLMVPWWGYSGVFLVSAGGRLLSAVLFARFVRNPPDAIPAT